MGFEKNQVIYNPIFNKFPRGANECGETITMKVSFPHSFNIWNLCLIIKNDQGLIEREIYFKDEVSFQIFECDIFWYYFSFEDCYGKHFLIANEALDAIISNEINNLWQLLTYNSIYKEPKWFEGKIMYQIMVDRFYKNNVNYVRDDIILHKDWYENPNIYPVNGIWNNDFFGGNLQGIISKLPYLKELNVGIIYLNPIFEAFSNHKYDTGDYLKIDRMFGSEDDFIELCKKAQKLDIRIIIDAVFNHSGSDSIYFNKNNKYDSIGAYNSKESKYYKWYNFIDYPNDYESWWGISTLPKFNQNNRDYRDFINEVLNHWLSLGATGIRIDVVDELQGEFVEEINSVVKRINNDNIIIGEVWEDASNKIAYSTRKHYFNGKQLDSVMNYVGLNAIIEFLKNGNVTSFRNKIRSLINNYPKHNLDKMMNIIDTHDVKRIVDTFFYNQNMSLLEASNYIPSDKEYEFAYSKVKMASAIQFTLPGVPCIYYGDEVGLTGGGDALSRKCYPWGKENEEIFVWYKRLSFIRKQYQYIFSDGEFQEVNNNDNILSYMRIKNEDKILIMINNNYDDYFIKVTGIDLINNVEINEINVKAQSAVIIFLK